jgi:chemotaxis protein histidine kinase CheA
MIDDDGIAVFRVEAEELLGQIEQGLLDLAHNPQDGELVGTVFRALHTLKGSGAMFGFDDLAGFTHHCETAFDRVRRGEVPASQPLITAVLNAMDHMRALAEKRPVGAAEGDELLAALAAVVGAGGQPPGAATQPDTAALPTALPTALPRGGALTTWHVRFTLAPDVLINGTRPLPMLDELRAMGPCQVRAVTDAIPTLDALTPTLCHLGWDILLTTAAPRAAIQDVFMFLLDEMALQIEALPGTEDGTETGMAAGDEAADDRVAGGKAAGDRAAGDRAAEAGLLVAAGPPAAKPPGAIETDTRTMRADASVRVPALRLDELMDRVGELVIAQSRLKQIAGGSNDMNLRSVAEEIEHLASELRDSMMSVRMVPIIQLFGRFRRLVHDLSRDIGKEIDLVTEGETTELDKTVIERLPTTPSSGPSERNRVMQGGDFVTLALGREVFAVTVAYVREILDYRAPFKIPEGPDYLLGLIDVRGQGTPTIDLRVKLGLPPTTPDAATRILVLDIPVEGRVLGLGLVADRVIEVISFDDADIEAAPEIGVTWRSDYIAGVVRRDSGFVVLFDLPKLLTRTETALVETARQRVA